VVSQDRTQLTVQLLAAASALRAQMGAPVRPVDQSAVEQALASARAKLGPDPFAAVWEAAGDLPLEQLISSVPNTVSHISAHLAD
jgi:hypothetical protein